MRKIFAIIPAMLLLLLTGSALAEGPQDTWKIATPAAGASIKGSEVTVTVDPGQMKVVKPGPVVAGEGHWHFLVDGKEVGKGADNTFTFKELSAGKHLLRVELHQGDHTPYPNDKGRELTVTLGAAGGGGNLALYGGIGLVLVAAAGYMVARRRAVRVG